VSVHPHLQIACLKCMEPAASREKESSRDELIFSVFRHGKGLKEMDHRSSYLVWDDAT
jgi:hypothetical protein